MKKEVKNIMLEIIKNSINDIKEENFKEKNFEEEARKKISEDKDIKDYWNAYVDLNKKIKEIFEDPQNAEIDSKGIKLQLECKDEELFKLTKEFKDLYKFILKHNQSVYLYYTKGEKIRKVTPVFKKLIDENNITVDDNNIVLLTKENSKIIEELFNNDPNYIQFAKYMFEGLTNGKNKNSIIDSLKNDEKQILTIILREIDRDNSTNVWRYDQAGKEAFKKVVEYIKDDKNNFFDDLKEGKPELPGMLLENVEEQKEIKSFCSKVCKYLNDYLYNEDKYYIDDSIIRLVLPYYLDKYLAKDNKIRDLYNESKDIEKLKYKELYDWMEELKNTVQNEDLKRSEIDHIMWYCYKSFKKGKKNN